MVTAGTKKKIKPVAVSIDNEQTPFRSKTHAFASGFLIAFLNPKVAFFFLAVFNSVIPQDISLPIAWTAALLAGFIDGGWYALLSFLVSLKLFGKILSEKTAELDIVFGTILIMAAITLTARALSEAEATGNLF